MVILFGMETTLGQTRCCTPSGITFVLSVINSSVNLSRDDDLFPFLNSQSVITNTSPLTNHFSPSLHANIRIKMRLCSRINIANFLDSKMRLPASTDRPPGHCHSCYLWFLNRGHETKGKVTGGSGRTTESRAKRGSVCREWPTPKPRDKVGHITLEKQPRDGKFRSFILNRISVIVDHRWTFTWKVSGYFIE